MFKPCPNCGFLVALIAGREASQRCPRCGSGLLEDGDVLSPAEREALPARRPDERVRARPVEATATTAAPATRAAATGSAEQPPRAIGTQAPAEAPALPATGELTTDVDSRPPEGPDAALAAPAAADAPEPEASPSFATRRVVRARRAGRRWPWAVALPLLALLLALQLLFSQRAELSQDPRWRPLLTAACTLLACEVPAWREPRAFAMLARNVRPHGTRAGVLHVTTSLRNDARWPQPLPTVVLSLSDVEGRVLAARAVAPVDYGRQAHALVAPGDSVDIAFDVREPSPRVVSFDFQVR